MGYLGRRIGKSQTTGNPAADGNGAGLLDLFTNGYFQRTGNMPNAPGAAPSGLTATGGVISDYNTPPGAVYRAHIFTSSGTFNVTAPGSYGDTVEYLVVAGGGGGGLGGDNSSYQAGGGGGGAGGLLSTHPDVPAPLRQTAVPISGPFPSPFTVTIGAGGVGGVQGSKGGQQGTSSSIAFPSPVSTTGGGGGSGNPSPSPQRNGGSGGGGEGAYSPAPQSPGGTATSGQGSAGGAGSTVPEGGNPDVRYGGGGGGAGGAGNPGVQPNPTKGVGGVGFNIAITGISTGYAGGGSAGAYNSGSPGTPNPAPPIGGGGTGGLNNAVGGDATYSTGGGGGGANSVSNSGSYYAGNGASGIVVVRYQIGQLTATAKATGGAISYYGGKTIHTFTSSGTFANPASISNVEIVMVAGGGAGGLNIGGGGGAGAVLEGSSITLPANTYTVTVGAGGAGKTSLGPATLGTASNTTISFPGPYTWTANRGGYGATYPDIAVQPGGSGGGGVSDQPTGGTSTSTPSSTPLGTLTSYGNAGATSSGNYQGAGGGGAGGAGGAPPTPGLGGTGGNGRRIPATFQNPAVAPSDTTNPETSQRGGGLGTPGPGGGFYIAGGGGGSSYPGPNPLGGPGGFGGGGRGGGGSNNPPTTNAVSAVQNTGGGGGGAGYSPISPSTSGSGGSGIVLIAYPS